MPSVTPVRGSFHRDVFAGFADLKGTCRDDVGVQAELGVDPGGETAGLMEDATALTREAPEGAQGHNYRPEDHGPCCCCSTFLHRQIHPEAKDLPVWQRKLLECCRCC